MAAAAALAAAEAVASPSHWEWFDENPERLGDTVERDFERMLRTREE